MLQLVNMFGFVLDRPLIQHHLRPHLAWLVKLVLIDLDQTKLLFYRQRKEAETAESARPPLPDSAGLSSSASEPWVPWRATAPVRLTHRLTHTQHTQAPPLPSCVWCKPYSCY